MCISQQWGFIPPVHHLSGGISEALWSQPVHWWRGCTSSQWVAVLAAGGGQHPTPQLPKATAPLPALSAARVTFTGVQEPGPAKGYWLNYSI